MNHLVGILLGIAIGSAGYAMFLAVLDLWENR